jgi:hypothetical protein
MNHMLNVDLLKSIRQLAAGPHLMPRFPATPDETTLASAADFRGTRRRILRVRAVVRPHDAIGTDGRADSGRRP